jgi:hypothetical protein
MCIVDLIAPADLGDLITLEYSAEMPWLCNNCGGDIIDPSNPHKLNAYFEGHRRGGGKVIDVFRLETPINCPGCGILVKETGYICHTEGTGLAEQLFSLPQGE